MSAVPREFLLRLQEDSYSRILSSEFLATVAVVLERRAFTEEEVKRLVGPLNARGGKVGACILVSKPIVTPEADNDGGRCEVVQPFTVLELPSVNFGDKGTGISAEEIAIELFDLFQFAAVSMPEQVFSGYPGGAIVPDDSFKGLNAWEVRMRTFASLRRTARTATPLITPDEGAAPQNVTLEAAAGAAIYYTLDGSWPLGGNPQAVLYSGPVAVAAAATLRAVAFKAGSQPSNVAEAIFT